MPGCMLSAEHLVRTWLALCQAWPGASNLGNFGVNFGVVTLWNYAAELKSRPKQVVVNKLKHLQTNLNWEGSSCAVSYARQP